MSTGSQLTVPGTEQFEKPNGSASLMRIIEKAVTDPTFDAAKLALLLDVKLKWEADEAHKAYVEAMQQFKANPPDILKNKHVTYGAGSGKVDYHHATLDEITPIIADALRAVGITHSWRTSDANGKTTVTCVLTHFLGHSEDAATLSGPADTSGGKNSIQAIGSTVTYLQRYTLLAATGLAAKGMDDDGKIEGMPEDAIQDYCIQMQDASDFESLKAAFKEAWEKSKVAGDEQARARFIRIYEHRKRELREARQ